MKTDVNAQAADLKAVSRNKKSGGYLLKRRLRKGTVSVLRALLLFGLCFLIIQPILTRISVSLFGRFIRSPPEGHKCQPR